MNNNGLGLVEFSTQPNFDSETLKILKGFQKSLDLEF